MQAKNYDNIIFIVDIFFKKLTCFTFILNAYSGSTKFQMLKIKIFTVLQLFSYRIPPDKATCTKNLKSFKPECSLQEMVLYDVY